ncbi:hypothetical protein BH23GEM3_BH23GEM3_05920 [soil metagenome]|nr:D-alanyl-D-alanine carboxypeptidase/D-alanyl-D-alanine-endopeptidase [Gemmatimonadota bacterium]
MRLLKYLSAPFAVLAAISGAALASTSPSVAEVSVLQPAVARAPATTIPTPTPAAPPSPVVAQLQVDLRRIIGQSNTGARVGVMVVSLDRGDTLFSHNADLPLAPASNMKLFSTAAALYYLGPEFRYSTYALADGDLRDGILDGNLILYGTGDPTMSSRMLSGSLAPLRELADTLLARGVREVQGDVVGDGSYFDNEWIGRGWSPDNFGASYSAPVGALSISENVASIRVLPGAAGGPARITTAPATQGLGVHNRVTTTAGGRTLVRFQYEPEGLVISGQIARGHPGVARSAPIVDPSNYAAAAFRSVLEERGIRVHGGVRTIHDPAESPVTFASGAGARNGDGQRPHPRVLAVYLSPTLDEVISVTNHVSQNLYAEALLKTVGRIALGEGTFDAGARAIRYFLECEAGADTTALGIVDGSGLSPLNRVTARATIQLLDVMTRDQHWEQYHTSLPEAGHPRPRGLNRMHGTAATGNLRAKTGTIRNVSALSGYVQAANGERLAFSIMANDLPASTWAAKRIEDAIGARIAAFRRPGETPAAQADGADEADRPATPPEPTASQATSPAAAAAARTHRVSSGETLDGIARRYDTTVRALEQANPGLDARRLQIGQTVRIPS